MSNSMLCIHSRVSFFTNVYEHSTRLFHIISRRRGTKLSISILLSLSDRRYRKFSNASVSCGVVSLFYNCSSSLSNPLFEPNSSISSKYTAARRGSRCSAYIGFYLCSFNSNRSLTSSIVRSPSFLEALLQNFLARVFAR